MIEVVGVRAVAANGLAFSIATLLSYLLNTFWTFRRRATGANALRFWTVALLGLGLTLLLSGAAEAARLHYFVGILLVIVLVPPLTFVLHSAWTYRG
ncbi:MAG: GtrA family protein [Steroidobacteraceae bacterium]|nr:GtrA family protein [Steroidobacteraceae bacterium]